MDKRIPNARIREVWLDSSLTTAEAAAAVGLVRVNLWRRAKAMGLPPRPRGRRAHLTEKELAPLWDAGVLASEIARHFDCSPVSVHGAARRLGLPRRPLGWRPRVTLADYRQTQLGLAMAQAASAENAALDLLK